MLQKKSPIHIPVHRKSLYLLLTLSGDAFRLNLPRFFSALDVTRNLLIKPRAGDLLQVVSASTAFGLVASSTLSLSRDLYGLSGVVFAVSECF